MNTERKISRKRNRERDNIFNSLSLIACLPGWYGPNCANKCGTNCNSCNRFNGDCEFGCTPGWEGIRCENGTEIFN